MMKYFVLAMILMEVKAIYFFLEPGMERCFKDEVVKNYVSIIIVIINMFCIDP